MGAFPPIRLCLIAPPLDGPPTGGTLYNGALITALRAAGASARACTLEQALAGELERANTANEHVLVDSLYLDHVAELQQRVPVGRMSLLLHWLPSQVRLGRVVRADELSASERAALTAGMRVICTSRFMVDQLVALGLAATRVLCVEPGTSTMPSAPRETNAPRDSERPLRALMLANVVAGKGLLPLLGALVTRARATDTWTLDVVGSLDAEPAYVAACRAAIANAPTLVERVQLHGPLAHVDALTRLATADLLVSASHMESYGMALAEARAAGIPIVALSRGNAVAHVTPAAGGTPCSTYDSLATELLHLARTPQTLTTRTELARATTRTRPWTHPATTLLQALSPG